MKEQDYKNIVWNIENYIIDNKDEIYSGEAETILNDLEEIINSYKEDKEDNNEATNS